MLNVSSKSFTVKRQTADGSYDDSQSQGGYSNMAPAMSDVQPVINMQDIHPNTDDVSRASFQTTRGIKGTLVS